MDSAWATLAIQGAVLAGTLFFGLCAYLYGRQKGIQAERLAMSAFIIDLYTWPDQPIPRALRSEGKTRRRNLADILRQQRDEKQVTKGGTEP